MVARNRSRQKIDVDVNPSGVLDLVRNFRYKLPDIGDAVAEELGDSARENLQRGLVSQGSDVTGQGKQSISNLKAGTGSRLVLGNYYLWIVDQGSPPHEPDTDTNRFQVWARQHGFTVDELAQIIADKGTRKHPFIDQGFRRTAKSTRKKAVKVLKRRL